jgi:predicted AAA+ superfamily ATPase
MNYQRPLQTFLLSAFTRPTPVIHVLIGPRQVCKTTIARKIEQFGYPPDMQLLATETVLKQAEMIANELAGAK